MYHDIKPVSRLWIRLFLLNPSDLSGLDKDQRKTLINIMNELKCDIPILLITWHGGYEEAELVDSPCNVIKINATDVDVCNYFPDGKIPNSARKFSTDIQLRKRFHCRELAEHNIASMLYNLDHHDSVTGRYPFRYATRTDEVTYFLAKDNQDAEAEKYRKQRKDLYSIQEWKAGEQYVNKVYSVYKEYIKSSDPNFKNDDRMTLFYSDGTEEDVFPSWRHPKNKSDRTLMDRFRMDRRDKLEIDLKRILQYLRDEKQVKDVLIIDLSCNLVMFGDKNPREIRRKIRTIKKNHHGGSKTQKPKKTLRRKKRGKLVRE